MRIRRIIALVFGVSLGLAGLLQAPAHANGPGGACRIVLLDSSPPPPGPNGLPRVIECYY
jgi:hypothetical protein